MQPTLSRLAALFALSSCLACGAEKITGPQPARIEIVTDLGVGYVLQLTTPQPIVQLVDLDGEPVEKAGVVITAVVSQGDVKVVGGGTATTNANGTATFTGLTFGALNANSGEFTVQYTSPGLTPASETEAITCRLGVAPPNVQVSGQLQDGDCLEGGARYRYYDESDAAPASRTAIRVTQTAPTFAPAVFIRKRHDADRAFFGFISATPGTVSYKFLAPTQQPIRFMTTSAQANAFGNFSLLVTDVPDHEPGCDPVIVIQPVSSVQALESGCTDNEGNIGDFYPFLLEVGRSMTLTVTTDNFTPYVSIWSYETPNVRQVYHTAGTNTATVTFQPNGAHGEVFYIFVGSSTGTGVGSYTLSTGISPFVALRASGDVARPVVMRGPFVRLGGGRGTQR